MKDIGDRILRFVGELRRRKTIRVAAAYIVVAWVLIEASSVVLPAFEAPRWVLPGIIITFVIGLPIVIVLSWIFDIVPGGLERTADLPEEGEAPTADEAALPEEIKPSIAIPLGDAQRRQVSLLHCSFQPGGEDRRSRDPEAMLTLVPKLEELIDRAAQRFSGLRLDSPGLSFQVLFGYPMAFENDALRAVAAALAIVREAGTMGAPPINATVGVHSDLAVIQEAEAGGAIRVVGDTPQIAAWLQSLASEDSVFLSGQTVDLLRGQVECEPVGEQTHAATGFDATLWRALRIASPRESLDLEESHRVLGRDNEIALILERWQLAREGEDQFVVLRGEPGIGKSTVVRTVVAEARRSPDTLVMPLFCSPFETSTPFFPIVEYLRGPGLRLAEVEGDSERAGAVIERLLRASGLDPEETAPLMATLLRFDTGPRVSPEPVRSGETLRAEVLKCLMALFRAAAGRGKLLILIEDMHWADPSTMEFIGMMVNGGSEAGALCLMTTRPETHLEWAARADVTVLDLQKLSRRSTEDLVRGIIGDAPVPEDVVEQIVRETGGNPLFAEELARMAAEAGAGSEADAGGRLELPATLKQSLAARIDRLGNLKPLLQLCSLLGDRFDYALLKAVSLTENEVALGSELRTLVNGGHLVQNGVPPEASYHFRHALAQESARNSLLKSTRVDLHARIASIIEEQFPDKVARLPEVLAWHHGEGGRPDRAVRYWTQACKRSLDAFAIKEAIVQARNGLRQLELIPQAEARDLAEIQLRAMLGKGLLTLHGYAHPEVEETFARALRLSETIENVPQAFQIVVGLWMYFFIGGEVQHALSLARRLDRMAEADGAPDMKLQAAYCKGHTLFRLGSFEEALAELERTFTIQAEGADFSGQSPSGDDTRIHIRCVMANALWFLGRGERALEVLAEGRSLAEEIGNPFGLVFALHLSAWHHCIRREPAETERFSKATLKLAEAKGFRYWLPVSRYFEAWASFDGGRSAQADDAAARLATMEAALKAYVASGAAYGETFMGTRLAEEMILAGDLAGAARWIDYVGQRMQSTGERFMERELRRVDGLLAQARGQRSEAAGHS